MFPGRTNHANESSHTNSYLGTWVEKRHPPVEVFEEEDEQSCKDYNPYDSHNDLWPGPRHKETY